MFSAVPEDSYDQNTRGLNQIWGFGIGRDFALTTETMATKITEYCVKNGRQSAPNLVVATNGMALKPAWADAPEWKGATEIKIVQSAIEATGYIATRHSNPLGALLRSIILTYQKGHTVSLEAFSNYLPAESSRPVLYYSPVPEETQKSHRIVLDGMKATALCLELLTGSGVQVRSRNRAGKPDLEMELRQ